MSTLPQTMSVEFVGPIGVEVKGDVWDCVEVTGSAELFGTGRSVRVDASVDGVEFENVGLMPTGTGGHMLSLSAKVREKLGKQRGESVIVRIHRRLT